MFRTVNIPTSTSSITLIIVPSWFPGRPTKWRWQHTTANHNSDEVKFELADAYFRKRLYAQALDAVGQVSEQGRKDDAYLALLGDIYGHLGDTARAEGI